jgi:adenosylhomocysteine nucleosidase
MAESAKIAIVAALEREVRGLVKGWGRVERQYEGRRFIFFQNGQAVLVCGGIGMQAARRATEAAIALYQPRLVLSAGFAGGIDPELKVGEILSPRRIIDARDGSSTEVATGYGVLVTTEVVAGAEQKVKLGKAYGAQAVDMEAASVARGAQARGVPFMAIKSISDERDVSLPPMERFVDGNGQFQTLRFVAFAAVRPQLWSGLLQLARNSAKAATTLSAELDRYLSASWESIEASSPDLHRILKAVN